MNTRTSPRPWPRWATAGLFLLALAYLLGGFHDLVTDETLSGTFQHLKSIFSHHEEKPPETNSQHAFDVRMRWLEQKYIRKGINPYDIEFHPENADPSIGRIPGNEASGYPPWAYVTQAVLVPPLSYSGVRWYLAFVNALAYLIISRWAYSVGNRSGGRDVGWFMVASCLACAGNAVQLRWGNYAAIVMALLLCMNYFSEREQPVLAGLFLGFAMLKPQNAMLFTFLLIARKQWSSVIIAVAYTLVAGAITAWRIGTNPLHMIDQLFKGAAIWTNLHLGIFEPLMAMRIIPIPWLIRFGLTASILLTAWLMWRYRARSNEVLMAIAVVISYVCLYHRRFDAMMLGFLLVPLAVQAFRTNSVGVWAALIVNGLFVWLPLREQDHFNMVVLPLHCLAAIWGLTVLLRGPLPESAKIDHGHQTDPLPA